MPIRRIKMLFSHIFDSPLKIYFSNASWLVIEKIILLPLSVFISIYIARYLGPNKYGLISYCQGFVALFAALSSLGIDSIVGRDLVKYPEEKNKYLGTSFFIKIVGFIVFLVVVCAFNFIFKHNLETSILVLIISLSFAFQSFNIIDVYFQAKIASKYTVIARICSNLISLLFKLLLILLKSNLWWFAIAILFDGISLAISYLITYKYDKNSLFEFRFSIKLAKKIVLEALPVTITGIAINIQAYIDQVLLGKMLNKAIVGQYSVAMNLITYAAFLPVIVYSTFAPTITRAKIYDEKLYQDRLLNLYRLMFIIFIISALPISLVAKPIVPFIYGKEYAYAGTLLALFSIRLFFTNFGLAKSTYIVNEKLLKYAMYSAILGTIINVALNILLIPKYQAIGAITATLISFLISTFFIDIFFSKMRNNLLLMIRGIFSFYRINIYKIK